VPATSLASRPLSNSLRKSTYYLFLQYRIYVLTSFFSCARVVTEQGIAAGRSPLSIAGACLYLVSHLMQNPKTPKEIGLAVEVSDGTIRTAYRLMHAQQNLIIKEDWIRRGGDRSKLPPA
jgi:transcription initiation factor TFIIB